MSQPPYRSATDSSSARRCTRVPAPVQHVHMWLTIAAFAVLLGVLLQRLYEIQVLDNEDLSIRAERQRQRQYTIVAPRGSIFDRSGVPLAQSVPRWHCYADSTYMDNRTLATVELAQVLEVSRDELRQQLASGRNSICLRKGLSDAEADAVRALGLHGVYLRRAYERVYPGGDIAPHVVGFVLDSGDGGAGLEQRFNNELRGVDGWEKLAIDRNGNHIIEPDLRTHPAIAGSHLYTTIDSRIQAYAQEQIAAAVTEHKAKRGGVIIVRPTTGEILAMASYPDFPIAEYRDSDPEHFQNQVLQFVYESGSTMKPLVAGAAVADGLVDWQQTIFCENGVWTHRIGRAKRTIHDHSYKHGGHQHLTVQDIIAKSDNIGMAKIGIMLGPERLYHWMRQLGFGQDTGIHLPGEQLGIMRPKQAWNVLGACMSVPMGHEIAVTPLQMVLAHAAVANRGVWNPPRLVDAVESRDPRSSGFERRSVHTPQQSRRIFSEDDALRIQAAMNATMTSGTGTRLQIPGYTSAGKTGTTEKLINGRYSSDHHIGSFVCWAPARPERPTEVIALAFVDEPSAGKHYGSQTGGPVVQAVLSYSLEVLGIEPDHAEAGVQ